MMKLFVGQPLALPGSAKNYTCDTGQVAGGEPSLKSLAASLTVWD